MDFEQRIINLVKSDEARMRALRIVAALNLPDSLIAAGFIRDLVWGSIFGRPANLNDIDVIYFCPENLSPEADSVLEAQLLEQEPNFPWSVKNQARMNVKNGDPPYQNTLDAMSYWPEKQTCIGAALSAKGKIVIRHCFDLSLQFNGCINHNPSRSLDVFMSRVSSKEWLKKWPALSVKT